MGEMRELPPMAGSVLCWLSSSDLDDPLILVAEARATIPWLIEQGLAERVEIVRLTDAGRAYVDQLDTPP